MPTIHSSFSLKLKIAVAAFMLTAAVTVLLSVVVTERQLGGMQRSLLDKALSQSRFASKELEPALAFDDVTTASEVFEALRSDPDFSGASLFGHDGQLLATSGDVEQQLPPGASLDQIVIRRTSHTFEITTPVRAREGATGVLLVHVSLRRITAARTAAIKATVALAAGALLVTLLAAWVLSRTLTRRLLALTAAANQAAAGDFDVAVPVTASGDEVGALARAISVMLGSIKGLVLARDAAALDEQARLEGLVASRTLALDDRNRELRLVLDSVAEGLVTVDADGRLGPEQSHALVRWFGEPTEHESLWSYLRRADPGFADRLQIGWDSLRDDVLPLELNIDQLPRLFRTSKATFQLRISPLGTDVRAGFLAVIEDATLAIERRDAEAARRDLAAALDQVLRDREAFAEFMRESSAIVSRVERADAVTPELIRYLHTLKGNCGSMGFESIAALCHAMESHLAETGDLPPAELKGTFLGQWRRMEVTLAALVGPNDLRVAMEQADHARLLASITAGASTSELLSQARTLTHEPAERRLGRLAEQARTLASRSGRDRLVVDVQASGIKLDPERWAGFWSAFVHVVRNAVTHGIETPEDRVAAGKPVSGRLTLTAKMERGELVIEAHDDGAGIDWRSVARAADARGLAHESRAELEAALFADGLSTRLEADDSAGRGVGLAAVREQTQRLGGRIQIETQPGVGTRLRFCFPTRATDTPARIDVMQGATFAMVHS